MTRGQGADENPVRLPSGRWRAEQAGGHATFAEGPRAREWQRLAGRTAEPPDVLALLLRGRPAPQPAPAAPHRVSVLVVDDEAVGRQSVAMALDDAHWDIVGEGRDGHEAIALAGRLRPDVVVLDVKMPLLDGVSALPSIRTASPDSVVVLFSCTRPDVDQADADGFVSKGGEHGELEAALLALTG